jgi:hypothetical protein
MGIGLSRLLLFAWWIVWLCHHRVKAALRYAPALRGLDPAVSEPESLWTTAETRRLLMVGDGFIISHRSNRGFV